MPNNGCFCKNFRSPKFIVQIIVIAICLGVSIYQLWECFRKVIRPPLHTHHVISINETMLYPSVTVCRWPAFKNEYEKYGLLNSAISYSSVWKTFNFENYTLSQFFEENTYDLSEYLATYALDGYRLNLDIESIVTLSMGRCFTFTPTNYSTSWGATGGYFFYMRHTGDDFNNTYHSSKDIGFYVYVHELKSLFSEKLGNSANFLENIFVDVGDALQYKLSVTSVTRLSVQNQPCNDEESYNTAKCQEMCLNKLITEDIGCSTPWLPNRNLPECNTTLQTKLAVDYSAPGSLYLQRYLSQCDCPNACTATMFIPYLQGEKQTSYEYDSSLSIYYSTSLVTVLEEGFGYDQNEFLADLGGSLGFLLGLSVLGVIAWIENIVLHFALYVKEKKEKREKSLYDNTSHTTNVDETLTNKIMEIKEK